MTRISGDRLSQDAEVVHIEGPDGTPVTVVDHGGAVTVTLPETLTTSVSYDGADSYQLVAADLELAAAAGTSASDDTAFLAPVMGNVLGDELTGTKNYVAGVIGAYSVTGSGDSVLPKAAVLGVIMDASTDADGVVVGHIDGSDPSSSTRAGAVFKATFANAHASSGVNYGLDLHAPAIDFGSQTEVPLPVAKADLRLSNEVCFISTAGVPVDYTDGDPAGTGEGFAAKGSLCTDRTNGKLYINTGTKAQPAWTLVGAQTV
jgi:hypothetical protein